MRCSCIAKTLLLEFLIASATWRTNWHHKIKNTGIYDTALPSVPPIRICFLVSNPSPPNTSANNCILRTPSGFIFQQDENWRAGKNWQSSYEREIDAFWMLLSLAENAHWQQVSKWWRPSCCLPHRHFQSNPIWESEFEQVKIAVQRKINEVLLSQSSSYRYMGKYMRRNQILQ